MKPSPHVAALPNLNRWRLGQGARIKTNRPIEVYLACEYAAKNLASVRDPLELTADELAIVVKSAISQERNKLHGPLGKITADEFWTQISAIAERWGIKTTRDQWERKTDKSKARQLEAAE